MSEWYRLSREDALRELAVDAELGLDDDEVARRLAEHGSNELVESGGKGIWRTIWEQLSSVLVVVLVVAAVVSAFLGDTTECMVILAIVVLNTALGFHQEYKAERSIAALKRLTVPEVKVRRGGRVRVVSARGLVPGDVVLLETGGMVPADGRLLASANLRAEEAALTGESEPVEKDASTLCEPDRPLAERSNMVFTGTAVTYGHGEALVTATGMETEVGRIATMLQSVGRGSTPLETRLDRVGRVLAVVALAVVVVVFVMGLLRGEEVRLVFLTAVSLAVAAVPEGLPAVVTIALALGAQRLLKRNALIRKLPAVETLGSVTIICSDKTGTLTQNRMRVSALEVPGTPVRLVRSDDGRRLHLETDGSELAPGVDWLVVGGASCNDALVEHTADGDFEAIGDPTEGALVLLAARLGFLKGDLDHAMPRVSEVPFDSVRKRMTTIHALPRDRELERRLHAVRGRAPYPESSPYVGWTKGAFDSVLGVCTRVRTDDETLPLDDAWRERLQATHDRLAESGVRVLAVAFCPLESPTFESVDELESDLTFLGLVGMIDPPRPEAAGAVRTCHEAGIRPVMITGDHPLTARYVADQIGIASTGPVLTGNDLEGLDDDGLDLVARRSSVFARVSPEHKMRLIRAYQRRNHIVAMTGDGVNDAPALKKADIGVAMGIEGTDVSKEAADIILRDDNFATIVNGGRGRPQHLRQHPQVREVHDELRTPAEIWVMLLGAARSACRCRCLPLQILWINLVTDGLPGLALGLEPPERDTMRRPPYPTTEGIFQRRIVTDIVWTGLLMGFVSLALGAVYFGESRPTWQTMVFTTLTLSQVFLALGVRSQKDSLFKIGLGSNRPLVGAVVLTFSLQLLVVYVPFLQDIFATTSLSLAELGLSVALSSIILWAVELAKLSGRRSRASSPGTSETRPGRRSPAPGPDPELCGDAGATSDSAPGQRRSAS